jgi:MinD-like ATPase involved in chromosome partitioning or flagellar assembly
MSDNPDGRSSNGRPVATSSTHGKVHSDSPPVETGKELVVSSRPRSGPPRQLTYFGGNTDRVPAKGYRGWLYEHGLNLGPTVNEIIAVERQGCEDDREILRPVPGALCIGYFSHRGGDGKSTHSTMGEQLIHHLNPVRDRAVLIDINTSMTTLAVLNGLEKRDFLTGKYWTMETLYEFLATHPDLANIEFDDINAKLAYRTDPQLPVIPLQLKPGKREKDKAKFSGAQYLLVLSVLKKFFNVILHDFGTEDESELTQTAFSQLHMLAVLTHTGLATTEMVAHTLEMLYLNHPELFLNTTVIFNVAGRPSAQALRAIAKEKAGPKTGSPTNPSSTGGSKSKKSKTKDIQTPGDALRVINGIIEMENQIQPLDPDEITLVGFDSHLEREHNLRFSMVSPAVQAQLWTALHRMLHTRVKFEREYLSQLPEGAVIRRDRDQMKVEFVEEIDKETGERYEDVVYLLPEHLAQPAPAKERKGERVS